MARKDANPGQSETKAENTVKALELRKAGKTYAQIGAALNVNPGTACRYVRSALDALARQLTAADKRRWHALQLERTEAVIAALMPAAETGDPKAAAALDKMFRRQSALLGLDEPARTVVSGDPNAPVIHKIYVQTQEFSPDSA